uniref:Small ribosomal subunit protein bS18c n=1 Tax=Johansenicoccus eremophilus TaxID=3068301 RepID=A0AA49R3P4_9CHLO|nr:ribosomal protein S18 [Chlorophyceae sp. KF-2023a]
MSNSLTNNRSGKQARRRRLRRKVLSISQILLKYRQKEEGTYVNQSSNSQSSPGANKSKRRVTKRKKMKKIRPIVPPKSLVIVLRDKPEKAFYNRRIIDYKHCGLLQKFLGLGGKILPRHQTGLTAKQQRYVAKTVKSARVMGLLPFVSKEIGFFR